MIDQALLLAAGSGERLRPLTDDRPKALIEAGGRPLIVRHLHKLAAAGIRDVVINTHHLAGQLHRALGDGSAYGLSIRYSDEQPQALETLGGIVHALPLLRPAPFLLLNADVFSDCDYTALAAARLAAGGPQAHLLLVENPPGHPGGDFRFEDGLLRPPGSGRTWTYSGMAAMHPALVAGVPDDGRPRSLAPLLREKAAAGLISAGLHDGAWFDAGTPERLQALREYISNNSGDP